MAWSYRGRSKYRAIPTIVNGIRFASRRESERYWQLFLMQRAGEIAKLEVQPTFKFPMGFAYKADFMYEVNGKKVVEDVKGFATPVFKLKEKCFRYFYSELELKITK
jgi:hypothetical protein